MLEQECFSMRLRVMNRGDRAWSLIKEDGLTFSTRWSHLEIDEAWKDPWRVGSVRPLRSYLVAEFGLSL